MTLFEFSQQIAMFKKEKKFPESLSYFRENKDCFTKEQIGNNEYIVSDMINCLRYSNNLDAGFQFLSIYAIAINEQQKERVLSAYGWLLWAKYKAENENNGHSATENDYFDGDDEETEGQDFDFDKSELLEKVETLIPILNSFNSDFTKTLSSNLFTIVLKSEKKLF